jgi:hypothetical protein
MVEHDMSLVLGGGGPGAVHVDGAAPGAGHGGGGAVASRRDRARISAHERAFLERRATSRPGTARSRAIKGVSLEAEEGRIHAVLGANGAGKTTLLKTIAGVLDPFKGSVHLQGEAIHGEDPDAVARRGVGAGAGGTAALSVPHRAREPADGHLRARAGAGGPEAETLARIHEWFPRLAERRQPGGRAAFRRRAADGGDRAGADGGAAAAAAGRAVAGAVAAADQGDFRHHRPRQRARPA